MAAPTCRQPTCVWLEKREVEMGDGGIPWAVEFAGGCMDARHPAHGLDKEGAGFSC